MRKILALILFILLTSFVMGATYTAASTSLADVTAAYNLTSASGGDTVNIPAGTSTWATGLTCIHGVTFHGVGRGSSDSVLKNGTTPDYDTFVFKYSPSTPENDQLFRVTNLHIDGNWNGGGILIENNPGTIDKILHNVRIDHCWFQNCGNVSFSSRAVMIGALCFGVADNNIFLNNYKSIDFEDGVSDEAIPWQYTAVQSLASTNTFVFETNFITNNDSRVSMITSGGQGGRYVSRYNVIDTTSANADHQHFDVHGTLGANRGTVSAEIYMNELHVNSAAWQLLDLRGGTGTIFSNRVVKTGSEIEINLREEDTGTYPLLDQITNTYIWNNTYGTTSGLENNITPTVADGAAYVQLDRDFFTSARLNYVPLTYPHPLVTAMDGLTSTQRKTTLPKGIKSLKGVKKLHGLIFFYWNFDESK